MNTSALKTFAPAGRLQLMEAVTRKLDIVLRNRPVFAGANDARGTAHARRGSELREALKGSNEVP